MGIISKIKSVLGVSGERQKRARDARRTANVRDEPETSSERAVKGVDHGTEPSPRDGGTAPQGETDTTGTGFEGAAAGERAGAADGDDDEPVDSIKGIGAAYAQRLSDAGIDSVAELARADADELAEATDLGPGRVRKWIEQAQARTK